MEPTTCFEELLLTFEVSTVIVCSDCKYSCNAGVYIQVLRLMLGLHVISGTLYSLVENDNLVLIAWLLRLRGCT